MISAGTFSFKFDSKMIVKEYKAKLYNFGKFIGEVKFTASCGRKGDFLAQQSWENKKISRVKINIIQLFYFP